MNKSLALGKISIDWLVVPSKAHIVKLESSQFKKLEKKNIFSMVNTHNEKDVRIASTGSVARFLGSALRDWRPPRGALRTRVVSLTVTSDSSAKATQYREKNTHTPSVHIR